MLHLPQLLYFAAFFAALSFAFTLPALEDFFAFLNKNKMTVTLFGRKNAKSKYSQILAITRFYLPLFCFLNSNFKNEDERK